MGKNSQMKHIVINVIVNNMSIINPKAKRKTRKKKPQQK